MMIAAQQPSDHCQLTTTLAMSRSAQVEGTAESFLLEDRRAADDGEDREL